MSALLAEASRLFEEEKQQSQKAEECLGLSLESSVWSKISKEIVPQERDAVRSALGLKLIQDNKDLREEVQALLEIIAGLLVTNDIKEVNLSKLSSLSIGNSAERALVEQNIHMMVHNIRNQAKERGLDGDAYVAKAVVEPSTPREKTIFSFLNDPVRASTGSSRPRTSRSRPGTSKSLPCSRTLFSESLTELKPYLTVFKIESVLERVRGMLLEEQDNLKADINYLQGCMEEEATFGVEAENDPLSVIDTPTTQELRELGNKLKTTWLENERQHDEKVMLQRGPNVILNELRPPPHPPAPPEGHNANQRPVRKVKGTRDPARKKTSKRGHKSGKNRTEGSSRDGTAHTVDGGKLPARPRTPPTPTNFNFAGAGDGHATPRTSTKSSRLRRRIESAQEMDRELGSWTGETKPT